MIADMAEPPKKEIPRKEVERRRDEALKRALNTPPKPRKNLGKVVPTKPSKPKQRKSSHESDS